MQMQDYFVVRMNDDLKRLITEYENRYGDEFSCPLHAVELFRKSMIVFGKPVNRDFRTKTEVKFAFLLDLHDDYFQENPKNDLFYTFLKTLLGEPPYTEHVFDQWWTIEKAGYCQDIEPLEQLFGEKGLWNLISLE